MKRSLLSVTPEISETPLSSPGLDNHVSGIVPTCEVVNIPIPIPDVLYCAIPPARGPHQHVPVVFQIVQPLQQVVHLLEIYEVPSFSIIVAVIIVVIIVTIIITKWSPLLLAPQKGKKTNRQIQKESLIL